MPITPSQRSPREWLWLVVALVVVGAICVPLWNLSTSPQDSARFWAKWTPERSTRLLIGPEQIACYVCFLWAGFLLLGRYREAERQRFAFDMELLPTEEGARILPEDARPLARKVEQLTARRGPFILARMIQFALGKYATSRKAPDVGEVVRTQAEVEQNRLVTSLGTVQYLTWAIPAIGFLGTVRGLAGGMSMAGNQSDKDFIAQVTSQLSIAFDCTFVALALSVVLMFLLHAVQRVEETLIIDCQSYCQEHLLLRLYEPQPEESPISG